MSNVVNLKLIEVGENFKFEATKLLEAAKSENFERMAIIGRLENGNLYVSGTANAGETFVLLEHARHLLAFGKDGLEQ